MAANNQGRAGPSSGPAPPGPAPVIERARRAGKYTHPFGGMRCFAEERAKRSGWDVACLAFDGADVRKAERAKVSDALAEAYREAFIAINVETGKGRPKANNISAAKKTVKMIAERVLLVLEARATQLMFKQFAAVRQVDEAELAKLRRIEKAGAEHPMLTYEQVVEVVREKLQNEETMSDEFLPGEKLVKPETAIGATAVANKSQGVSSMKELVDDDDAGREALKQALVEMRAEEVNKGSDPRLIGGKWVQQITAAANELVAENYGRSYANDDGGSAGGADGSGSGEKVLGCAHFRRKNRVLMACCGTFPVCRMCHFLDQTRIHDIRIEAVETMLCVECGNVQPKAQNCTRCNTQFGTYYCEPCGITDNPVGVDLRHCEHCRVCMPGLTFHCDLCRACFTLPVEDHFAAVHNHRPHPSPAPGTVPHAHAHAHGQAHDHSPHALSAGIVPQMHHGHTHAHASEDFLLGTRTLAPPHHASGSDLALVPASSAALMRTEGTNGFP